MYFSILKRIILKTHIVDIIETSNHFTSNVLPSFIPIQEELYLRCLNFIVVICYTVTITARKVIDKMQYLAVLLEVTKCLRFRCLSQCIFNYTYCWVTTVLQVHSSNLKPEKPSLLHWSQIREKKWRNLLFIHFSDTAILVFWLQETIMFYNLNWLWGMHSL